MGTCQKLHSLDLLVDGSLALRVEGHTAQALGGWGLVHSGELSLDLQHKQARESGVSGVLL